MIQTKFYKNMNGKVYIKVFSNDRKMVKRVETDEVKDEFIVQGKNFKGVFKPIDNKTYIEVERVVEVPKEFVANKVDEELEKQEKEEIVEEKKEKQPKIEYKYNCVSFYFLQMESGFVEVPDNAKKTFKVIPPQIDDYAIAGDKKYKFNGTNWEEIIDE